MGISTEMKMWICRTSHRCWRTSGRATADEEIELGSAWFVGSTFHNLHRARCMARDFGERADVRLRDTQRRSLAVSVQFLRRRTVDGLVLQFAGHGNAGVRQL